MYDVLAGVRVVEVAAWLFAPSCGAVLADWGADVVKVEHPVTGDPYRGFFDIGGIQPMIEFANRGKRSIGIDLATDEGRELLYELVEGADVFVTNLLAGSREKLGIDIDDIRRRNSNIIYIRASGYGPQGPDASTGGFDIAAAWARVGICDQLTGPDATYAAPMPGGIGDCVGGLSAAGAVAGALFRRERTGVASDIDVSLFHGGLWLAATLLMLTAHQPPGTSRKPYDRFAVTNPLMNSFKTKDGRWLYLALLQPDPHWPSLCEHLGRPELATDPRFVDFAARMENCAACVRELDAIFATRTLDEWRDELRDFDGVWAPVQTMREVLDDPQVAANGYLSHVTTDKGEIHYVTSPAQFDRRSLGEVVQAPEHAQHTEEILLELGFTWDRIIELKEVGAIS